MFLRNVVKAKPVKEDLLEYKIRPITCIATDNELNRFRAESTEINHSLATQTRFDDEPSAPILLEEESLLSRDEKKGEFMPILKVNNAATPFLVLTAEEKTARLIHKNQLWQLNIDNEDKARSLLADKPNRPSEERGGLKGAMIAYHLFIKDYEKERFDSSIKEGFILGGCLGFIGSYNIAVIFSMMNCFDWKYCNYGFIGSIVAMYAIGTLKYFFRKPIIDDHDRCILQYIGLRLDIPNVETKSGWELSAEIDKAVKTLSEIAKELPKLGLFGRGHVNMPSIHLVIDYLYHKEAQILITQVTQQLANL